MCCWSSQRLFHTCFQPTRASQLLERISKLEDIALIWKKTQASRNCRQQRSFARFPLPLLSLLRPSAFLTASSYGSGRAQGPSGLAWHQSSQHGGPHEWGWLQPHGHPGPIWEVPEVSESIWAELDFVSEWHSETPFTWAWISRHLWHLFPSSPSPWVGCRAFTSASWCQYDVSRTQEAIPVTKSWPGQAPLPGRRSKAIFAKTC